MLTGYQFKYFKNYKPILGLVCTTSINTGNSKESLIKIGAACSSDESAKIWTKEFEPAYDTKSDKCTGYVSVPLSVKCDITAPALVKRLCNCVKNGKRVRNGFYPSSAYIWNSFRRNQKKYFCF